MKNRRLFVLYFDATREVKRFTVRSKSPKYYTEFSSIFNFMKAYRCRENKDRNYSNRKQVGDYIARVVLGFTDPKEPFKLAHISTGKYRKNI